MRHAALECNIVSGDSPNKTTTSGLSYDVCREIDTTKNPLHCWTLANH